MTILPALRILAAAMLACLLATAAFSQDTKKKSFVLTGKVEEANGSANSLTVTHPKIEGYMAAMTMPYKVDKAEVFKKVKKGDQIKATVYDGDYTLYNVEVVPPASSKK